MAPDLHDRERKQPAQLLCGGEVAEARHELLFNDLGDRRRISSANGALLAAASSTISRLPPRRLRPYTRSIMRRRAAMRGAVWSLPYST